MARSSRSSVRLWSAAIKYRSSAHRIARNHPVILGGTAIAPTHVNARRKSKQVVGGGDTNSGGIGCRYGAGALAQLCWSTVRLTLLADGKGIKLLRSTLSMLTGFAALSVHQQLGTASSQLTDHAQDLERALAASPLFDLRTDLRRYDLSELPTATGPG